MAITFVCVSGDLEHLPGGRQGGAALFVEVARAIVRKDTDGFMTDDNERRPLAACRAYAENAKGEKLLASSSRWEFHAEEALLELMKNWPDFKYIYVEIEPCHDGAFGKPVGKGCMDKLKTRFPRSTGFVFYTHPQAGYTKGDASKNRDKMTVPPMGALLPLDHKHTRAEIQQMHANAVTYMKVVNHAIATSQPTNSGKDKKDQKE